MMAESDRPKHTLVLVTETTHGESIQYLRVVPVGARPDHRYYHRSEQYDPPPTEWLTSQKLLEFLESDLEDGNHSSIDLRPLHEALLRHGEAVAADVLMAVALSGGLIKEEHDA
jgi:hypothetical protein